MRPVHIILGASLVALSTAPASAQTPAPPAQERIRVVNVNDDDQDRAALGVQTASGGKRDTLGLLITQVTAGGPAEKAGLEEGNRIAAINGVSLTMAAADAGEPDMDDAMTRRLVRELRKVKAGDEVSLKVYAGGTTKTMKVKTVELSDLSSFRKVSSSDWQDRAVLGLSFGGGSKRDSLGILVTQVVADGPAEKAGIEEGNRIAAINGVNVRVPGGEAGESGLSYSKQERFSREMQKVKAGAVVDLQVYANGSTKSVKVTAARAEDVYKRTARVFRSGGMGEGFAPLPPLPPLPPTPPAPGWAPRAPGEDGYYEDYQQITDRALREAERALRRSQSQLDRDYQNLRIQLQPLSRTYYPMVTVMPRRRAGIIGPGDDRYGLSWPGLRLTDVGSELSSYFGAGSAKGLLVLQADDRWKGLKSGDVILTANGKAVRDSSGTSLSLDPDEANSFVVLRHGKKVKVAVAAR